MATPPLLAQLQEQAPVVDLSPRCQITGIYYAGDEGGILCKLDFGQEDADQVFFVSITHLTFDRRLPLAREIAAYQKHRVKRIASQQPGRRRSGRITESPRPSEPDQSGLVNMARKSSSARFKPSSVNTTDLALLTGSPIRPFS